MSWNDDRYDRFDGMDRPSGKAKVCVTCRKIILRKDDLHWSDGKSYCTEHVPAEE
jgi:hypothetical protein